MSLEIQTIELDCPPGSPRPWDLIQFVCEGTVLNVTNDVVPCMFGLAQWAFVMEADRWASEVVPVIRPRIEQLYHQGQIRYGSW